jgi:endonuclease/exonuclease/phosphatase family metal-dependent hydrolase
VFAGDFNDVWGTLGKRVMKPAGFRTGIPIRTFPSYAPMRALDSIYVRGDLHVVHLQTGRIAAARAASDHLPLIADLHIRAEQSD